MSGHGIGRREFVKGVCAAALAGVPLVRASQTAASGPSTTRPGLDLPVVPIDAPDWLSAPEALFRPTPQGATVHWVTRDSVQAQVWAGVSPEGLAPVADLTAAGPAEAVLRGFAGDTDVYYRCRFRRAPDGSWVDRPLQRFHTTRPAGRPFRVALIADTHVDRTCSVPAHLANVGRAIDGVLADQPDFVVFLGDEPGVVQATKSVVITEQSTIDRWRVWRQVYARLLSAVPSFMVLGNHEGEAGFYQTHHTDRGATYPQRWGTIARKQHYLNPLPDTYPEGGENEGWLGDPASPAIGGAAAGNCSPLQNYFAWTWGDALFIVLDVHRYTRMGQGTPTQPAQWTLGSAQLAWFEQVLRRSTARWKLVFAHHLVGGWAWDLRGETQRTDYVYGRGGARYARVGEQSRITDLMHATGARLFFYGHDHIFAHQQAENIHFVCCGRPSFLQPRWWVTPGWKEAYGDVQARNPYDFYAALGFTRLSIAPDEVRIAYVRTGTDPAGAENVTAPMGTIVYECTVR